MEFNKEQMLKMHEYLVYSRHMAELIIEYIKGGKVDGTIHPGLGQEAISAGILAVIDFAPEYKIWRHTTHRQQPIIAKTIGLDEFVGEMMCKRTGILGGMSGEYHCCSLKDMLLPMTGILGAGPVHGTGYAWSLKADGKKNEVCLLSIGDGAMSQGIVYEAMNMASIMKLPVLYVVENNQYAFTTPLEDEAPLPDLYHRAEAAGMVGASVDGNDVEAVVESLLEGLKKAANNEPTLLEMKTLRWDGHFVGEVPDRYRDMSFRKDTKDIDPIYKYEQLLLERGVIEQSRIDEIHHEQRTLIIEAFDKGAAAEYPTKEECLAYSNLYSNDAGGAI